VPQLQLRDRDGAVSDIDARREKVAEILRAHQPTTDNEKRVHHCLEFHFVAEGLAQARGLLLSVLVDAKAWHRHAIYRK
jgi:hypothetical protein